MALTEAHCNDEISLRFSLVLRQHGRSRRTRSRPLNSTELAFYPRNSHRPDFLMLFGRGSASLVMLRDRTSRLKSEMQKDTANGSRRSLIYWWVSKSM